MGLQVKMDVGYGVEIEEAYIHVASAFYDLTLNQWFITVAVYPHVRMREAIKYDTAISEITAPVGRFNLGFDMEEIPRDTDQEKVYEIIYNKLKLMYPEYIDC